MRIAMFVSSFPVWTETFILNQIAGLIDRGHSVDIYSRSRTKMCINHEIIEKYKMKENVIYASYNTPANKLFRALKAISLFLHDFNFIRLQLWAIAWKVLTSKNRPYEWTILSILTLAFSTVHRANYDIIHCQFGNLGPIVLFLKNIGAINGNIITSFRGHDATQYSKINSGMYHPLFQNGLLFLPVSEDIKKRLINIGCPADKIRVLHSGIDCNKFKLKTRTISSNAVINIISIARLVEMKGLAYSIQAVANLIMSGRNISYMIIGDGILRNELEQLIRSLGVEDGIHLPGWMNHNDVIVKMQSAHIMVVPSVTASRGETEGIPNAAKEAMAMGIPVVGTINGGIPELVEDGVSGYLVPERDINLLTDRLSYLCDHHEIWGEMGKAGRKIIESEFDINKLNNDLVKLYQLHF